MSNLNLILNNLKETPPPKLNDHIMIIDGLNTLIRSFTLVKAMNSQGHHVGGLVGFLRSLGYLVRTIEPTRVIVVWDGKGGSTNRKNINSDYKAHRTGRLTNFEIFENKDEESESLSAQLERLLDYLDCLPVQHLMIDKFEADDIIAYIAKGASESSVKKCTIVSSDRDFLQLVDSTVQIFSPIKKKFVNIENIIETIGVRPDNYNVVKALLGDNSDGIKGVRGVGIKTLVKEIPELVTKKVSLDYIYDLCEERIETKKMYANIIYNWDTVKDNFTIMDLHNTTLDILEEEVVKDLLREKVPKLRPTHFLSMLEDDLISGITKNTEGWLDNNFRALTLVK